MKKSDIRNIYTNKLNELLNEGYTIFPDTMGGSQGEIAHIDLSKDGSLYRLLLQRTTKWDTGREYPCDIVEMVFGKAAKDTRVGDRWDGTIWNNELEVIDRREWAIISDDWLTDDWDEVDRIHKMRGERRNSHNNSRSETLGDEYKPAVLNWLRRQPRMKGCKASDIESIVRWLDYGGNRYIKATAKGRTYRLI